LAATQVATRHYAKRQLTWFRRDARVQWLEGFGEDPQIVKRALESTELDRGTPGERQ
jgi:tRNA dimethylallyltransferase